MKVLTVDNNAVTLSFLSELLSKEGFEVIQAHSGHEALEHYKKHQPDFICLDILMPDLSGYDVCKTIRKTDEITPIILDSIYLTRQDAIKNIYYHIVMKKQKN